MAEYIAKGDNGFHSLVRPILEYASSIWNPYKTKNIEAIENVQRRATKMLPDMKDLTYEERLRKLKLLSLRNRRHDRNFQDSY